MKQENLEKVKKIGKILKWVCFFFLSIPIYLYLLIALMLLIGFPMDFIISVLPETLVFNIDLFLEKFGEDAALFVFLPAICSPFAMYLCAKLFGFFKVVDDAQVGFFIKLRNVFLVSFLLFVYAGILSFVAFGLEYPEITIKMFSWQAFALIPAFFLYKFFQFLTKKYPCPFEKIGYYSSVEFYKTLFRKLFENLKEKFKSKFGK